MTEHSYGTAMYFVKFHILPIVFLCAIIPYHSHNDPGVPGPFSMGLLWPFVKFHIIPIAFSKADILYGNTMETFEFRPISLPYDLEITLS